MLSEAVLSSSNISLVKKGERFLWPEGDAAAVPVFVAGGELTLVILIFANNQQTTL